jgi:hypothetical protein
MLAIMIMTSNNGGMIMKFPKKHLYQYHYAYTESYRTNQVLEPGLRGVSEDLSRGSTTVISNIEFYCA